MVDKVQKSDIIIILSDVNAKFGKETAYRKITAKYTLHVETNRNGELLCDFSAANNMLVMGTQFQQKQIHKGNWRSPDYNIINQTDHVLVNQNKEEAIEDVRSLRGPKFDSHHYLLKTTLKQKLPNIYKKKPIQFTKRNKTNIQESSKLKQYRISMHNKLKNIPDTNNINEEWRRLKKTISHAAKEVIQTQGITTGNEQRDEECR